MIVNELTYEDGFLVGTYIAGLWNEGDDKKPNIKEDWINTIEPYMSGRLTKNGLISPSFRKLIKDWVLPDNILNLNAYYEDPEFVKGIKGGYFTGTTRKINTESEIKMTNILRGPKKEKKKSWIKRLLGL